MRLFHGRGRLNISNFAQPGLRAIFGCLPGQKGDLVQMKFGVPSERILDLQRLGALPLTMVAPEKPVKLVEIMARGRLRHRLTELGLTPGVELKVLQNKGGPLLLAVHNTRLALGRGMAHKIMVQAVAGDVASE